MQSSYAERARDHRVNRPVVELQSPRAVAHRTTSAAGTAQGMLVRVWLGALFGLSRRAPWVLELLRPLAVVLTVACSPRVRRGTRANAERIMVRKLSWLQAFRFSLAVVGNFYDFVADMGRSQRRSAAELLALIEKVEGREGYDACRALKRGCVIVTAHMGSFEVGLARLTVPERNVHVVFKRDGSALFESLRSHFRQILGVHEAAIDDGWDAWLRLRDALLRDEVVVMQGDRAMPGQRSQVVPFRGGHLRLPLGPIRLAHLTGSPIIPVSTTRSGVKGRGRHRFVLRMSEAIVLRDDIDAASAIEEGAKAVGRAIEAMVVLDPEQWLVLTPAFEEDRADVE